MVQMSFLVELLRVGLVAFARPFPFTSGIVHPEPPAVNSDITHLSGIHLRRHLSQTVDFH